MIDALIVENEKPQSDYLSGMLSKHFPEVNVMGICDSVPMGVEKVNELKPHLIFLDVELPPYTGFDLLEQPINQSRRRQFSCGALRRRRARRHTPTQPFLRRFDMPERGQQG